MIVDGVGLAPGLFELEPGEDDLEPQVVLLVGHDRDVLARVDGDAARALAGGQLAADEVPLDEAPAVDLGKVVDLEPAEVLVGQGGKDGRAEVVLEVALLVRLQAREERTPGDVARKAHPRREDDIALGTLRPEPAARRDDQVIEFHPGLPSL